MLGICESIYENKKVPEVSVPKKGLFYNAMNINRDRGQRRARKRRNQDWEYGNVEKGMFFFIFSIKAE